MDSGSGDIFKPLMSFMDETNSTNMVATHPKTTEGKHVSALLQVSKWLNLTRRGDAGTMF